MNRTIGRCLLAACCALGLAACAAANPGNAGAQDAKTNQATTNPSGGGGGGGGGGDGGGY